LWVGVGRVWSAGRERHDDDDRPRPLDPPLPHRQAVIDEVGKALSLKPHQTLPMLEPFARFGNTSSSSTWYAWSYVETFQKVKKGDRVWQLGFGSGFKCCSAAWTALRDCGERHDAWVDAES